jgi:hypothetical protein
MEPNYKRIAELLWNILDDIDTLGDEVKPERNTYFICVQLKLSQRHMLLKSDGEKLSIASHLCDKCGVPLVYDEKECQHRAGDA